MAQYRRKNTQGKRSGQDAPSSKATPARLLALEITREVREREAYARELIDARRATNELPEEEFNYAQVLAFGVVMCRGTLDMAIDRSLNSPKDVKPKVRDALRISAYELLFLGKPAHVVTSQGVELVRSTARKAAGLANAVLRKMVEDAKSFPWGDATASAEALAVSTGLPLWLVKRLEDQLGFDEAAQVAQACLKPAPTYTLSAPFGPQKRFASDLAAQQAASMVPVSGTILEIGAGRGTKTCLLQARALGETGAQTTIHTVDIHAYKEMLLKERLAEMGIENVVTHTGDARYLDEIDSLPASFDAVFVDAPCSGTGTLRRHPEIRWNLTPDGVADLAALQLAMLKGVAPYVKSGGALVYATCSILKEENGDVVEAFLASEEGSGFSIDPAKAAFSEFESSIDERGCFASLPVEQGPDGHFAARLIKR